MPSLDNRRDLEPRLPEPDADARARSDRLAASLREEIADAGGALPFARFMERVLYAPGLGYYSTGASELGAAGDFVTAPEISTSFSACVARQLAEILERLGGGDVLEAGAGSGAMAAAVLDTLAERGALPRRYLVLERSAALRERQRAAIAARGAGLLERVQWLDAWPEPAIEGVIVANELLDAIPVTRFVVDGGRAFELRVALDGDRFAWRRGPFADERDAHSVRALLEELDAPLPDGYVSEIGPQRDAWVCSAGERLARGAMVLLDYGFPRREYYHPDRSAGTLRCHYRHRAHDDALILPGLQDVGAHVDFTAIARASPLELAGFTTQADFLIACGVLDDLAGVSPGTPEHVSLTGRIKRLTLPGEMGEAIKAIALVRGMDAALLGFTGRDHRRRL